MKITSIKGLFGSSQEEEINPIEAALATVTPVETVEAPIEVTPVATVVPVAAPSIATITAVKVFKVGNKEYSTKEEAISAAAMEVLHTEIPKGLDNVIAKAADIISALRVVGKK